jgi:hypothetical protein
MMLNRLQGSIGTMEQMLGGEFSAGLSDLSSGLEDLRNQSGAITSLDLTSVLLRDGKKTL